MEIIQERLEREYNLEMVFTAPRLPTRCCCIRRDEDRCLPGRSARRWPGGPRIREPWMNIEIITPTDYYGPIMELVTRRRGVYKSQEYPAPHRVQLNYEIPLSEIIIGLFR